ncbi:hypothetical protein CAEBREN_00765 [Caenorhabditis brenneri]|uniref:F-box domain-containing protein n=1 Tax=Caenorhabditis brenneri TaxID=135651 RepID=G0P3E3_CAEBE|nr:hypothetical protein CAEBREN_00765 [Caenorhabditis brenneri]
MSKFFKNNPIALRHCIRFEILQGNSIEQAYSNICTVLGEEVIDYKKFEIRFNHFSKKKFNDKEQENPCAKILRNDKYALRVCILYESLKYQKDKSSVPVFEVFVKFCKVILVEDVLKYPEFEFWFYRFINGEYDLNYERDDDKKIYELMDMPIDVMENIVKYLNIVDRANLVQTSQSLQTFVKDQKLFQKTLKLIVLRYMSVITFGESVNSTYTQSYRSVEGCTPEQALLCFKSIIKNPKLHLDSLVIELDAAYSHLNLSPSLENAINNLEDALKFTNYLDVKELILAEYSWDQLSKILPSLKPGYLTTIRIISYNPNEDSMKKVFEMEQWKQAKCFEFISGHEFIWPLHHLYHFNEFSVFLETFTLENIRQMKETLFKSTNFKKCTVMVRRIINMSTIEQELGVYIREDLDSSIYHYPIPNSTEYFEITIDYSAVNKDRTPLNFWCTGKTRIVIKNL